MDHAIELAYVGVEVTDADAFAGFLTDTIGLVAGEPRAGGERAFRNDDRAFRLLVREGPSNDAVVVGIDAFDAAGRDAAVARLRDAGYDVDTAAPVVRTQAPWGVPFEIVPGLAKAPEPFASEAVPGGFLTEGVGFGHLVFATPAFEESHRFVTEGLGMVQSDWVETEIAPGFSLEVRFYHCNARHHSVALARAPFELPQKLHHVMLEVNDVDDVGAAFDRVWATQLAFANGLGRHDNDRMFSFYVVTPAGFQLEFGHGARTIGEHWDDNRRYTRASMWGHQPVARP